MAPDFSTSQKSWLTDLGATPVDISLKRADSSLFALVVEYVRLKSEVQKHVPDVLLTFFAKPNILGGFLARRLRIERFVPMVEGLGYAFGMEQTNVRKTLVKLCLVCLYRLAFQSAKHVIFLNNTDRAEFENLKICHSSVSKTLGPIGVQIKNFPIRQKYPEKVTFILCARMIVEKGVREFAAAAKIILEEYPETEFHLLGDVDDNPLSLTRNEINTWVSAGILKWHGHVDVVPYLYKASVFVLPTYYREGVPRSVQEAMAAAMPVITTKIPGCEELVKHEETGVLINQRDVSALVAGMILFLENPDRVSQMGKKARLFAERYLDSETIDQRLFEHLFSE